MKESNYLPDTEVEMLNNVKNIRVQELIFLRDFGLGIGLLGGEKRDVKYGTYHRKKWQ
jgi:hypothetical protein